MANPKLRPRFVWATYQGVRGEWGAAVTADPAEGHPPRPALREDSPCPLGGRGALKSRGWDTVAVPSWDCRLSKGASNPFRWEKALLFFAPRSRAVSGAGGHAAAVPHGPALSCRLGRRCYAFPNPKATARAGMCLTRGRNSTCRTSSCPTSLIAAAPWHPSP